MQSLKSLFCPRDIRWYVYFSREKGNGENRLRKRLTLEFCLLSLLKREIPNFHLIPGSINDENPEEFKFDIHTTFTVSL